CGHFKSSWLLSFLGLESFPAYRDGGRLQNYRGEPPLSDGAFAVLQKMVVKAAENLETFNWHRFKTAQHLEWRPVLFMTLAGITIEAMAAQDALKTFTNRFNYFAQLHG